MTEHFKNNGNVVDSIRHNNKTSALPEFALCPVNQYAITNYKIN